MRSSPGIPPPRSSNAQTRYRCGFQPMKRLTLKANVLFLLSALTLYTAPAVCQQDGDQPPFQLQILPSGRSEIPDLLKQAQSGDRIAQFNLASRYLRGVEVPQDYKDAAMWYERAAERVGGGRVHDGIS